MPFFTTKNIFKASFRGAEFLVEGVDTTDGRQQIIRRFVNSDRTSFEDLGALQPVFKINAIITGPNYITKRNNLIRALKDKGIGLLIHPTFGSVNVITKTFGLTEDFKNTNVARFLLTFHRVADNIFPEEGGSLESAVTQLSNTLLGRVTDLIADVFGIDINFPFNFQDALFKVKEIADFFERNSNIFGDIGLVQDFYDALDNWNKNQVDLIQNPLTMGEELRDLFSSLNNAFSDPEDAFEVQSNFYDFAIDEDSISGNTVQIEEQQKNRDVLNTSMRINPLALNYRNASLIEYTSSNQIDTVVEDLESQYRSVIKLPQLNEDTKDSLNLLRNEFRKFIENERLSTSSVSQITTNQIPMSVLAYKYYGNTDNTNILLDLNPGLQSAFISGEVNILTP